MAGTSISFDSNSLQTANIITSDIDHESHPAINAQIAQIAHANQSVMPFRTNPNKIIRISGKISDSSIANLDSRLDTFRSYFTGQDKNLDIGYNGTTRRYIATATDVQIARPNGLMYAEFSIEFTCLQPYGQDTTTQTALNATGRTLNAYTDAYTFLGTALWQRPIVTITLTAVTGGTSQSMTFSNNVTGQTITINRTWSAGDVVVIDATQKTVTVNGNNVAFTGAFPEFSPGAQTLSYTDSFTTRTFNINVVYYPMYL